MSGLGIEDLGPPPRKYRIDLHVPEFETRVYVTLEDRIRAQNLRADAARHGGKWGKMARALADKLDPDLNPGIPDTPASARYWRYHRINVIGWLAKLIEELGLERVRRCDIVRENWRLDLMEFLDEDPVRLKKEFRAVLNRSRRALKRKGIDTTGRFFIAGLHGDFDPVGKMFQLHYHCVEEHPEAAVAKGLRGRKGYVSPRRRDAAKRGAAGNHVTTPVRVSQKEITNLLSSLGYLLKGYWLQYPRGRAKAGSKKGRRRGLRMESPYLSTQLLWMDECRLSDLVLMIGLRVTKEGLKLTRPVHE